MRRQQIKFRPSKRLALYCDENFPYPSLLRLSRFKVKHAILDFNFNGRDDEFHYQYATQQKAILLTLDDDYLNNRRFKIDKTYGLIVIQVGELASWERINKILDKLIPFLKSLKSESLKNIKICTNLEGYVKWILKDNKIQREEFKW